MKHIETLTHHLVTEERLRERMVVTQIEARGVNDPRVLHAVRKVPRHLFVPENRRNMAYADNPLPIGACQTISQPYMVALMTEALNLKETDRILEIGTGSGYQAAILAEIVKEVYTIERIPELYQRADKLLKELGYKNIYTKCDDGTLGWPEKAPFDGIVVTAAAPRTPSSLIDQMNIGSNMIIPVGNLDIQGLCKVTKQEDGSVSIKDFSLVRFVPLIGQYAWGRDVQ